MKIKSILKKITIYFNNACDSIYEEFRLIFDKYGFAIIMGLIAALAIVMRYAITPIPSHDLYAFIFPWLKNFRENGNLAYLGAMQGDYPPLYMTLLAFISYLPSGELVEAYEYSYFANDIYYVKTLSFIFDFVIAIGTYLIVTHLYKENKGLRLVSFALPLLLPTVITNSAFWGQCDAIYVGCVVMAVYFLIKDNPKWSSVFLGLAFAFKIQTIFIVPLFGFAWLRNKFPLRYFLLSFLTLFITFIPCYLAGASFISPFEKYGNLTTQYMDPNLNSGSMYTFIQDICSGKSEEIKQKVYEAIHIGGIMFALIASVTTWYTLHINKVKATEKSIVAIGALFAVLMPFVMPHMHERYFFMADIMIMIYCLVNKKKYYLIILSQLSSIITLMWYTYGSMMIDNWGVDTFKISTIINAFMIIILFKDILSMPKEEKLENQVVIE